MQDVIPLFNAGDTLETVFLRAKDYMPLTRRENLG
ncbi:MAG: hypothetical protein QG591_1314 [Planctomycetota bacterium]|nr:hypothetical protein [Planctomycetota bacterium]